MLYFIFGLIWLLVGGVMLLLPLVNPNGPRFTILDTGISFGWLLLFLAGFNFFKGWLWRLRTKERQHVEHRARPSRSSHQEEYDPSLDFTKEAKQSPDQP